MNRIVRLKPVFQSYLWGGRKIKNILGKDTGDRDTIAESWEISTHPNGQCIIAEREHYGKTLGEYLSAINPKKLRAHLPFMVKFIDARESLSVQVHPNNDYARRYENDCGKNEMWYIAEADQGAFLYLGLQRNITQDEILHRINNRSVEKVLNKVSVQTGEFYYVPSGTVHAIGAGCLICELQQSSDLTYRLYDYGRKDANGNTRELHIAKALEVMRLCKTDVSALKGKNRMSMEERGSNGKHEIYTAIEYKGEGKLILPPAELTFALALSGEGELFAEDERRTIKKGDTLMILGNITQICGKCKLIIITLSA